MELQQGSGECQYIEVDVGAVESEIRNVEFGWKIEFLFLVLGGSVIPGHCGEKTDSDDLRLIVCKWTKHLPVTDLPTFGSGATEPWNQKKDHHHQRPRSWTHVLFSANGLPSPQTWSIFSLIDLDLGQVQPNRGTEGQYL